MINWIKSFFVTEEKETKPKCASCGLGATKYVLMEFKTLALEELEEKIMIKICDGCYDEIYERYNPNWLPPPVQKRILE
tara:strand:- start:497 stop:733 length:237 start_codon:yes stop_codon:yes gene_type:complete